MPTVLRIRGYRFYFFALEDTEPPHVHVDKGSGTIKLWLHDHSIARMEGLKPAEIREVLHLTSEHHHQLLKAWHEFQGRKS